jgi:hypothetical protein
MGLLDRIRPGGASERARVILTAAEAGLGDDDAAAFADRFKTFDAAKVEVDRRAAEAAKPKAATDEEIADLVALARLPAASAASVAMQLRSEGATMEAARRRIITMRAEADERIGQASSHITLGHSWDHGAGLRDKLADGLTARLDPSHKPTMGREFAHASLVEMAVAAVRGAGHRPLNTAEAVRMAVGQHSQSDFPKIVEDAMSNVVARGITQQLPATARVSREVVRPDYHAGKSLTLSASGMPQEIAEGGEIKFTTMDEKGEALPAPRDFGAGFSLTNKVVVNANGLDILTEAANRMVQGARERFRSVLLEPILANAGAGQTMADGKTMFHVDHGNTAATGSPLTIDALAAARLSMRRQKGPKGELYAIEPAFLYVPPDMETTAQQLVAQITAATVSDANPFSGRLEVVVEPGLSDPAAWYLVGAPSVFDGHVHAFLDGRSQPVVESRPGWNTLGIEFRLVWALDAKFIETAAWYRNAGV